MMTNDRVFLDTNVLVYLVDEDAEYHEKALEIFSNVNESYDIWISRQILREYAVVVSRMRDVSNPAKPLEIAEDLEKWESAFFVADETSRVTTNLRTLISKYSLKGKRIHDANIVATMMEYEIKKIVTWNIDDFKKFDEIELEKV